MTPPLTVWSVFWGTKYHAAYVYALRDAVEHYLTIPHSFRCITCRELAGIDCVMPGVDYAGWWQKIDLWNKPGPSLYFDLDTVIVDSLDYLEDYARFEIAAPANWSQSGHGGIQSSVLAWSGTWREPVERFEYARDSARLWGDQEYLTELRGNDFVRIPGVYSYKYHCRRELPADAAVVVFHGKPDPHEVQTEWLSRYTQTLRSRISGNTARPWPRDFKRTA